MKTSTTCRHGKLCKAIDCPHAHPEDRIKPFLSIAQLKEHLRNGTKIPDTPDQSHSPLNKITSPTRKASKVAVNSSKVEPEKTYGIAATKIVLIKTL